MAASREDVDRWIEEGKRIHARYIISVCDTFDWDDYPVYVMPDENLATKTSEYSGKNMQRINEIITIDEDGTVTEGIKKPKAPKKQTENIKTELQNIYKKNFSRLIGGDIDIVPHSVTESLMETYNKAIDDILNIDDADMHELIKKIKNLRIK